MPTPVSCDVKKSKCQLFLAYIKKIFGSTSEIKSDSFYRTINQIKLASKQMTLEEKGILNNLLKFSSKTVQDVMIPRSDIAAVNKDATLKDLNKIIVEFSLTRVLVYENNLDNIIGFIHIKDLFRLITMNLPFQLKKLVRKHVIAVPSMKLIDLLVEMQKKHTHIAIVIDEYGGTDGIVTIEDLMEEIVGRIEDEHDRESNNENYKILSDGVIISSSRVEVEELEAVFGIKLKDKDDEFDTIGGMVLAKVGYVPAVGTKVHLTEDIELEVIDASNRNLRKVKLYLNQKVMQNH